MDDNEGNKSDGKVKVDISPIMPVKTQEIFGAFWSFGSFRKDKAQEQADKSNAHDTQKKKGIY
jgi:hypothetical protein